MAQTSSSSSSSSEESIIISFYNALASGDVSTIQAMVAEDLEWRFHGPPSHQHLMRMLTGADRLGSFSFHPSRICTIGERVFAEGKGADDVCWVHVWSINAKNGRLVELNECFNTSVTVTAPACATVWQSQASRRSMPGLVFAM